MIDGRMTGRTSTKEKRSFTLSRSSVAYLERLRIEKKAASTSGILDELIRNVEAHERRNSTEEAISAYYSSLSADEEKENRAWGNFAAEQLKREQR
jgi:hypothetical protein